MLNSIKTNATVFHLYVLLVKRVLLVMQYTCNSFPANRTVAMATGLPRAHHQKAQLSLIHSRLLENTQQTFPKHTAQGSLPALMHGHAGFPRLALFTDNDLACCHDPLIRMNLEKGLFKVSLTWMFTCMRSTMPSVSMDFLNMFSLLFFCFHPFTVQIYCK